MKSHVLAKILGWGQFGLNLVGQATANGASAPHGWQQWLAMGASFAMALGMHASSNTDGTK